MVGIFINTLPTRVHVRRRQHRDRSWLRDLQDAQAEARQFDFVPLAQLQAWSDLPGGGQPVRQHRRLRELPHRRATRPQRTACGCATCTPVEPTNYPLSVVASPGQRLSSTSATTRRCSTPRTVGADGRAACRSSLAAIADGTGRWSADIDVLPEAERRRVLAEWNDTAPAGGARHAAPSCSQAAGDGAHRTRPAVVCDGAAADLRRAGRGAPTGWRTG